MVEGTEVSVGEDGAVPTEIVKFKSYDSPKVV
jgi:hypothetical protein